MNHIKSCTTLAFSFLLASLSAIAYGSTPTLISCGHNAVTTDLSIQAIAWTSMDDQYQPTCPLLEEKETRKLVDKFGGGTTFAHPMIPYTCLSGTVTGGALQLKNGNEIEIDTTASHTESAQRLFPVPDGTGLFATSTYGTLQAGAAMTAIHLEGYDQAEGNSYKFDLLLDDHFLITPQDAKDTEDFLIVGSKGDYKFSGRLTGRGQIISQEPLGIMFEVTGTVCLN